MNAINTGFIMLCSLLVLLMTPALAMFYSGMVKRVNTINTIMNCFIVFGVITFVWLFVGFSIAFGADVGGGFVGDMSNFMLKNVSGYNSSGVPNALFVVFQMAFALIAGAIITGSLVGRVKLGVLVIFLVFWSALVYSVLAHMIWSEEGFLLVRGGLDFAGGGVVHISSGVAGLVGVLLVGPRKEIPKGLQAHSIPYTFLGGILLFIGWLGFNAGSAGAINDIAVNAFIVTIISASSGFIVWILTEWILHKKPTMLGGLSGLVAGLVGITPGCGFVSLGASIFIGGASALICYVGLSYIKYGLKLDDSLDAFSLHGIGGVWGGVATGLFASKSVNADIAYEGLFVSGDFHLFGEQLLGIGVCIALSAVLSFVIFKAISIFTSLRVSENAEIDGLDVALHGEEAYND
ncbi:ammonium transporter [Campylobacter gastrosuis]|uniref:Ammonium transporter n=1 Tax=Campylobacter gastrosuis TaxID=2974576 RepID=A0ABT7HQX2_9BACT|nr:ammonium transporter [Campylobacter gastrosuis]MDL0088789.1 ammonium transporter [Campylobacter gastrosuis]